MFGQYQPQFLLTRPLPQSHRFAAELAAHFGDVGVIISPLMQPVAVAPQPVQGLFDAVIFTSESGVMFGSSVPDLPKRAFCVGDRTADSARAMGFDAISAHGNWRDLAGVIKDKNQAQRLLYLRAQDATDDLQNTLISAGLETISRVVYRQDPLDLSAQARAQLANHLPVIVPLFSARSAQLFSEQLRATQTNAPIFIAALSAQVADSITFTARQVQLAQRPNSADLLAAIGVILQVQHSRLEPVVPSTYADLK